MEFSSLSPLENHEFSRKTSQLEISKSNTQANRQIEQGMSPKEISEVVSNHLIDVVKQQFELAKQEYRAKL